MTGTRARPFTGVGLTWGRASIVCGLATAIGCAQPSARPTPTTESTDAGPTALAGRAPTAQSELRAAIVEAEAERYENALQRCRAAIAKDPNLEHAYLLMGSVCGVIKRIDCEREAYQAGLKALPDSVELLKSLGLLHLQQGEPALAVVQYERARDLTGGRDAATLADLAYAYVYVERLDEAGALARQAVAIDAQCFACWMSLGQASLSGRRFDDAVDAFGRAQRLEPDDTDAARGQAKALLLAGRFDEAAAIYERLIDQFPEDGRLRVQAAQVAMKRGRFAKAVHLLEPVVRDNPNRPQLRALLDEARLQAGRRP